MCVLWGHEGQLNGVGETREIQEEEEEDEVKSRMGAVTEKLLERGGGRGWRWGSSSAGGINGGGWVNPFKVLDQTPKALAHKGKAPKGDDNQAASNDLVA